MRSRKRSILYVSPLFTASFILLWIPWGKYETAPKWLVGLHLIVALFLFDGLSSFVQLAWSAIFSEATTNHIERVRAIKYMQIMHLLGHNVIFVLEKLSRSLENYRAFQIGCLIIAFVALLVLLYTGTVNIRCFKTPGSSIKFLKRFLGICARNSVLYLNFIYTLNHRGTQPIMELRTCGNHELR